MSDFWKETPVKRTRKNCRCRWCYERIEAGQPSVTVACVYEGSFTRARYHPECCSAITLHYHTNRCWGEEMPEEAMERGGIRCVDEIPENETPKL